MGDVEVDSRTFGKGNIALCSNHLDISSRVMKAFYYRFYWVLLKCMHLMLSPMIQHLHLWGAPWFSLTDREGCLRQEIFDVIVLKSSHLDTHTCLRAFVLTAVILSQLLGTSTARCLMVIQLKPPRMRRHALQTTHSFRPLLPLSIRVVAL